MYDSCRFVLRVTEFRLIAHGCLKSHSVVYMTVKKVAIESDNSEENDNMSEASRDIS